MCSIVHPRFDGQRRYTLAAAFRIVDNRRYLAAQNPGDLRVVALR
jgi:hypothetical protein